MIQDKEIPSEYISLRQIWLKRIDDCGRAISQRAVLEPNPDRMDLEIGDRTVVYTVQALYNSLVDYGEATVRSDVNRFVEESLDPRVKKIWDSNKSRTDKWVQHAKCSIELYGFVVRTLNKYGMLFEKQPQGYSNVEMRSIEQEEK